MVEVDVEIKVDGQRNKHGKTAGYGEKTGGGGAEKQSQRASRTAEPFSVSEYITLPL